MKKQLSKKHLSLLMLFAALIVPWMSSAQDCTQTVPYLEGFEGVTGTAYNTAGTLPACWNGYYNGTTAAYVPHVVSGSGNYSYQHSGVNSLVMTSGSSTYGNTKIVALPPMSVPLNQLQLSFWMCTESSSSGTLYVGYLTSNDTSSFVSIASYPASSATVHSGNGLQPANVGQEIELPLDTVPATATRLAFKWYHNSSYYSCCIDDVVVGYPPTCPKPLSMVFSNIAATEATVSWIPTGSETQWEIVYNGQSVIANDTTYTFTDLTPNTQYDVAIRAICSAADSSYFINGNFRTSCTAISSLPYQNGFEDDPFYLSGVTAYADAFPSCWTRINDASSASYNYYPYISTTTSYVHSGQNALYWYHTTSTSYANNQYAVLPPVDLNAYSISDLTLAFYAKTTSSSYHPQPIVGVMTDPGDASTFTDVETFSDSAITTEWKLFTIPLASYTGTGNYIAIKWPRPSSLCYLTIDDVFLTDGWCDALEGDVQAA